MHQQKGFIQIIVIIVLIIVIVSLLGISLKEIFGKLSSNQEVNENFTFIKIWIANLYNKYLKKPIRNLFNYSKNYLLNIFTTQTQK